MITYFDRAELSVYAYPMTEALQVVASPPMRFGHWDKMVKMGGSTGIFHGHRTKKLAATPRFRGQRGGQDRQDSPHSPTQFITSSLLFPPFLSIIHVRQ